MKITPLSPVFGAQIDGVDGARIEEGPFEELYRAWLKHGVLRLRGQNLDDAQLEAFSSRFGPLEKIPIKITPEIERRLTSLYVTMISNIEIDGRPIGGLRNAEANWHSDMTFCEDPPPASILFAVEIPSEGGDTQFSCQHAALDALPTDLRRRLTEVRIKHDASHTSVGDLRPGFAPQSDPRKTPGAVHPAILRHPENGREALYLGRREFAHVQGMEPDSSESLLDELWHYACRPENIWTQSWRAGDLIIWDNRRVLHRRDGFSNESRRLLKRCQVLNRSADKEAR